MADTKCAGKAILCITVTASGLRVFVPHDGQGGHIKGHSRSRLQLRFIQLCPTQRHSHSLVPIVTAQGLNFHFMTKILPVDGSQQHIEVHWWL